MNKQKITSDNLSLHLIEYQLAMVGHTFEEAKATPNKHGEEWFNIWSLTEEQAEEFKNYAIKTIKRVLQLTKIGAEKRFDWFNFQYGLRMKKEN